MSAVAEFNVTMDYRLLSKQEVAKILGYTVRTIDRLVTSGKIPYRTLPVASGDGRKIKFDSRELEAWITGESLSAADAGLAVSTGNGGENNG